MGKFILILAAIICVASVIVCAMGAFISFLRTKIACRCAIREIKKGEKEIKEIGKAYFKSKGSYCLSGKDENCISKAILETYPSYKELEDEYKGESYSTIICLLEQQKGLYGEILVPEFYKEKGDFYIWLYAPLFIGLVCIAVITTLMPFMLFGIRKGLIVYLAFLLTSKIAKDKNSH